jgi:hypothetical protein
MIISVKFGQNPPCGLGGDDVYKNCWKRWTTDIILTQKLTSEQFALRWANKTHHDREFIIEYNKL